MDLLILFFTFPFAAAFLLLFCGLLSSQNTKKLAFILSLIPLVLLSFHYSSWLGESFSFNWIPSLQIQFYVSIDSLSMVFLFLTAFIIPLSLLVQSSKDFANPQIFYSLVLLLQGFLFVFFTARDLVLFTFFYEAMLLPLFFIIHFWGGPDRRSAAFQFILYMLGGAVFLSFGVLAIYFTAHSFNMDELQGVAEKIPYSLWIFLIFILAFAVKTPLFPFHAWLPKAYTQAPWAGTILLAALLSKAGIYGFLRIGLEIFPQHMIQFMPLFTTLAILGVFYGGLTAWAQNDYKRLIAYSSFSHVNFVLVGVFNWNEVSQLGAILQALNHGITITALFVVAAFLEKRLGTTSMGKIHGVAKFLPYLAWLTLFFVFSSIAVPGTNNFIGEFLILFGLFQTKPWITAVLALSIILTVMYMLKWMQKLYFEAPTLYEEKWVDLRYKEWLIALPLLLMILWIGIYPKPFLEAINPFVEKIQTHVPLREKS